MDLDIDAHRTQDHRLLTESLGLVAPVAADLVASFYDRLFHDHPEVRAMFPAVMDLQRERLLKAIIALVTHYDHPEQLMPALAAMGRNHVRYGAQPAHFDVVGSILLDTLAEYAGPAWSPDYEAAWTRAYTFAATTMIRAGEDTAGEERLAA
jgi:hemoglobin-like flavoprotein